MAHTLFLEKPKQEEMETGADGDGITHQKKTFNLRFPAEIHTTIAHFCSKYMDKYAENHVYVEHLCIVL